jgi:hypothetical protein
MANPTTNYSFVLPTSTDLVTDLPADFDVALQGVDTRLKALNPETTLGDISYASATANTNTRLPIGTTGQVLAVVGGVPAWSSEAGDISAVTAGTGLSGGGTSGAVTVSIDTAVTADLTTAQTLTNKTLTAPVISSPKISSTYSAKTAAYTFASGDEGNIFSMNNAATQQFNIPTDATFNFAVGTEINVFWITGAGQPTIGAVTPGTTTVISTGATSATPKLRVVNSGATCKKLAANSWIVFGDIS